MKTTQYVSQEKAIARADSGGIRERWLWGLRLLRDPEAMSSEKSLKHGVSDQLIAATTGRGLRLSSREIRYRLQCARSYPTEAEIGNAVADFETWHDLVAAGFPAYEAPLGEPPADHRTDSERDHDRARALLDLIGEQGSFFPASRFEPTATPLKDLVAYTDQQEEITKRFAEHDKRRRAYLDDLVAAADNDLSVTWQEAQDLLDAALADEVDDYDAAVAVTA